MRPGTPALAAEGARTKSSQLRDAQRSVGGVPKGRGPRGRGKGRKRGAKGTGAIPAASRAVSEARPATSPRGRRPELSRRSATHVIRYARIWVEPPLVPPSVA